MEKEETKKSAAAEREERILEFWKEKSVFEKSLAKDAPNGEFVFYEGPPTANGKPGIHHLEARAFKDAIPRYKTMRGFRVRRKGGWDTHGLPVELQVEKTLGLTSKKQIEEYGIAAFNEQCKESVWAHLDIWNKFTHRIGYWVDQENPYVTYRAKYVEALWAVLGKVAERDLLYKDYRIVPWCPRCGTALSSHELAQGYQDVKDLSVTAKFKLKPGQKIGNFQVTDTAYILAWTTTPWTLPGNVALAVGESIEYAVVTEGSDTVVVAKDLLGKFADLVSKEPDFYVKGSDLVGLEYEPLYPFLKEQLPDSEKGKLDKAFRIHAADFVTTEDGTGVVHTAVMYGQDDFVLGTKLGLPKFHMVDETGHFIPGTGFLEGRFVKDEDVAVDIIKDLASRGLLFKKEKYEHSYPHCWRCKTPLIYYARDSWYIRMSELRDELVKENEGINWEPSHIKEGRFGEWLREIKDWAISRERYWGTPLPVWEAADGERIIVDSIDTMKRYMKRSGNTFFVARHGEAEHNTGNICSDNPDDSYSLTEAGKEHSLAVAEKLKGKNIDVVYVSPFVRTKETAAIIAKELGLSESQIIVDERIREFHWGDFAGKAHSDFAAYRSSNMTSLDARVPNGESYQEAKARIGAFLRDVDQKQEGQNILLIGHGILQEMVPTIIAGAEKKESFAIMQAASIAHDHVAEYTYYPLPYNKDFELDLHRPYVDDVVLDKDGKEFRRIKEVMDVWFDSGAMPFAQTADERGEKSFDEFWKTISYPADFISEAIDQTRGWFYTLHAIGVLMGRGKAYKNVVCLGHILDAEGKKMSKSLGNIVDPWIMMDKYGVDALRLWMYSVNQPGESKNFDEKTVDEIVKKIFNLIYNVHAFYDLYRGDAAIGAPSADNVLDRWIVAKLHALVSMATERLENFQLIEPVRGIREFADDLSTWYLRRSRDRIKEGDAGAIATLGYVLKTLSKLFAPFAPFVAEDLWQKLKGDSDKESVHLAEWPEVAPEDTAELLKAMTDTRSFVTLGLEARQKAGIKVRQPLAKLSIKGLALAEEYLELIRDEVNVKAVVALAEGDETVVLDTDITPELREEGIIRELVRAIQDMRKNQGLMPSDRIALTVATDAAGQAMVSKYEADISGTVAADGVKVSLLSGDPETTIDSVPFTVQIEKK